MLLPALVILASCTREADSLFDPEEQYRPDPVITEITPDSALAGITEITIAGEHFSPNPDENVIFFKEDPKTEVVQRGSVLSASANELRVVSPPLYSDSVQIKLSVLGALKYAVVSNYKLMPAVETISLRLDSDAPNMNIVAHGVAIDQYEDAYVLANVYNPTSASKVVRKLPFDGSFLRYVDSQFLTDGVVTGPGDTLFAAADLGRTKFVAAFPPGEGSSIYKSLSSAPRDLDFGEDGNVWIAAEDEVLLYSKSGDGSITSLGSYPLQLMQLRHVDNRLYLLGQTDKNDYSEQIIWTTEIQEDDVLGDPVELVNSATATWLDTAHINSFALDADGRLYVATSKQQDGVHILDANGDHLEALYPGLISAPIQDLTWGNQTYLYGTQVVSDASPIESNLLKIDLQRIGSKYWGREL